MSNIEDLQTLKKRLLMRAEHRGIKEMDIILGGYVRQNMPQFDAQKIDEIERFMQINDQALYQMILGNEDAPDEFTPLIKDIRAHIELDLS